jgi:hypothetical protein
MFVILAIIALILTIFESAFSGILIGLVVGIVWLSCVPFLVNMKLQPRLNFQKRYYEIDENFITTNYEDGSISKLKYEHFVKAVKQGEYYFLYITPAQFHYIPVAAFNLEDEIHRFDLLLQGKQLMKLW